MQNVKERRIFDILRDGKRTKITLKENHISKVVVEKKDEIFVIFRNGNWYYYDYQNNIFIKPANNANYKIKAPENFSELKLYCKAWDIDIECENIWREALSFVRHLRIF